jgi:hypothetical protein
MTTGRINQVTTFRPCIPEGATHDSRNQRGHFLVREFIFSWSIKTIQPLVPECIVAISKGQQVKSPCSPISQILDTPLPVADNRDHGLQRELPTTGSP